MRSPVRLFVCFAVLGFIALEGAPIPASAKPAIFVLGDSTTHNTGKGKNGQPMVGWGTHLADFFDPAKVTIENAGHAGQSSRTYYSIPNDWPRVRELIKPGDFVLLVFGINDVGAPQAPKSRGSIPGLGDETVDVKRSDGSTEIVHTYGWYMSQMANGAREKGAHVYLLTVTTRNIWANPKAMFRDATPTEPLPANYDPKQDRIERGTASGKYTAWTKDLGQKLDLPVFDLTNYCADRYERMGRETVDRLYSDHNHTYAAGAKIVAESVVAGLKAFPNSPFLPLLSDAGRAIPPADARYISTPRGK